VERWDAAERRWTWQIERFGFATRVNIGLAWALAWSVFAAFFRFALAFSRVDPIVPVLVSLYAAEGLVFFLRELLRTQAQEDAFLERGFTRALAQKRRDNFESAIDDAWEYVHRWIDWKVKDEFTEAFLLKQIREDSRLQKDERPATVRATVWAIAMETFERHISETWPWNKTAEFLRDVRDTFRAKRISPEFREHLGALYLSTSPSYKVEAAKKETGKEPDFVTAHPWLAFLIATAIGTVIGSAIPTILKAAGFGG
jgi:ElaB/YqjD/DUF883 family membrane-anchored ribosome-binding protein